jgi:heme o synthase
VTAQALSWSPEAGEDGDRRAGPSTAPHGLATAPSAVRARSVLADLVDLTKPRIVGLLVFTGAATAVVAAGGWPGLPALATVALGGGMAAAGAGSINCGLEGELDRQMARTRQRPVAAGRLPAGVALAQGLVLNLLATVLIVLTTNWLAAGMTLLGSVWYVGVYTVWLKPRTTSNIVVGGLAGSFPPLVGWAAVTGGVGVSALALAGVIFLWTPPHFWALASLADQQYRDAGIPMLPAVAGGSARAARAMLAYTVATVAVSVIPVVAGDLQTLYLAVALAGGVWMMASCRRHLRAPDRATARQVFLASIVYLAALFLAAAVDASVF